MPSHGRLAAGARTVGPWRALCVVLLCGYLLSAASSMAVERLRLLGVPVMQVTQPGTVLGETYRETAPSQGTQQDASGVGVNLVRGVIDAAPGSYYVPVNQPLGSVVLAALEPDTQSSYFANHLLDSLQSAARVLTAPSLVLQAVP